MAGAGPAPKISASKLQEEAVMSKAKTEALEVRLDVLSAALVALAREVAPDRVAAVREGLLRVK